MKKYFPLLVIALCLVGCASQPVVQMQQVPVTQLELDAAKIKSVGDVRDVFEALGIGFTYPVNDAAQGKRYSKIKRLCK